MAGHRKRTRGRRGRDPERPQDADAAEEARRAADWAELLARKRKRYAEDPEYRENVKASNNAYKDARRAKLNAYERHRYATNPDYRARALARSRGEPGRRRRLMSDYGITLEDYDAMLAAQNGACAICRRRSQRRLAVDHCHLTGMVRALLCDGCNKGLGNFEDQPGWLRRAADLLEEARARYAGVGPAPIGRCRQPPPISLRLLREVCRGPEEAGRGCTENRTP